MHQLPKKSEITSTQFTDLQAGSQEALRHVYEAYYGFARFTAKKLGASDEDADDLIQDAFVALYEHAKTIKSKEALTAWLVTTISHKAIDRIRKQKKSGEFQDQEEPSYKRVERVIVYELEVSLIGKELTEFCAESSHGDLQRFYIEGMSVKQLAAINGESTSAVTTRLTRLRRKFKDLLEIKYKDLFS